MVTAHGYDFRGSACIYTRCVRGLRGWLPLRYTVYRRLRLRLPRTPRYHLRWLRDVLYTLPFTVTLHALHGLPRSYVRGYLPSVLAFARTVALHAHPRYLCTPGCSAPGCLRLVHATTVPFAGCSLLPLLRYLVLRLRLPRFPLHTGLVTHTARTVYGSGYVTPRSRARYRVLPPYTVCGLPGSVCVPHAPCTHLCAVCGLFTGAVLRCGLPAFAHFAALRYAVTVARFTRRYYTPFATFAFAVTVSLHFVTVCGCRTFAVPVCTRIAFYHHHTYITHVTTFCYHLPAHRLPYALLPVTALFAPHGCLRSTLHGCVAHITRTCLWFCTHRTRVPRYATPFTVLPHHVLQLRFTVRCGLVAVPPLRFCPFTVVTQFTARLYCGCRSRLPVVPVLRLVYATVLLRLPVTARVHRTVAVISHVGLPALDYGSGSCPLRLYRTFACGCYHAVPVHTVLRLPLPVVAVAVVRFVTASSVTLRLVVLRIRTRLRSSDCGYAHFVTALGYVYAYVCGYTALPFGSRLPHVCRAILPVGWVHTPTFGSLVHLPQHLLPRGYARCATTAPFGWLRTPRFTICPHYVAAYAVACTHFGLRTAWFGWFGWFTVAAHFARALGYCLVTFTLPTVARLHVCAGAPHLPAHCHLPVPGSGSRSPLPGYTHTYLLPRLPRTTHGSVTALPAPVACARLLDTFPCQLRLPGLHFGFLPRYGSYTLLRFVGSRVACVLVVLYYLSDSATTWFAVLTIPLVLLVTLFTFYVYRFACIYIYTHVCTVTTGCLCVAVTFYWTLRF